MTAVRVENPATSFAQLGLSEGDRAIGTVVPDWYSAYVQVSNGSPRGEIPETGTLDIDVARTLVSCIRAQGDDNDVFLAIWAGYAGLAGLGGEWASAPLGRELLVFRGTLDDALLPIHPSNGRRAVRWWPKDVAWAIGADIYSGSVILGGSKSLVAAVAHAPSIQTRTIERSSTLSAFDL